MDSGNCDDFRASSVDKKDMTVAMNVSIDNSDKDAHSDQPIVYVVDDDTRVRAALTDLISSAGMRVISFGSGTEFLSAEKPDAPACLILDMALPDLSGLDVQQELAATAGPPIVFITGQTDIPSTVQAMKAGAVEFLSKPFSDQELLRAVEIAIDRDRTARRERSLLARLRRHYQRLTPREREVLSFVVGGHANKETAAELGTSEVTIGVHRSQIMRKMEARSLAELVRMADTLGIRAREPPR